MDKPAVLPGPLEVVREALARGESPQSIGAPLLFAAGYEDIDNQRREAAAAAARKMVSEASTAIGLFVRAS